MLSYRFCKADKNFFSSVSNIVFFVCVLYFIRCKYSRYQKLNGHYKIMHFWSMICFQINFWQYFDAEVWVQQIRHEYFQFCLKYCFFCLHAVFFIDISMQNIQIERPSQENAFLVNDLFSNKFSFIFWCWIIGLAKTTQYFQFSFKYCLFCLPAVFH